MEHFDFKLRSAFEPTGDQPEAIKKLTEGVLDGVRTQVLVGVTGSGKTFTMANVIKNAGRPQPEKQKIQDEISFSGRFHHSHCVPVFRAHA